MTTRETPASRSWETVSRPPPRISSATPMTPSGSAGMTHEHRHRAALLQFVQTLVQRRSAELSRLEEAMTSDDGRGGRDERLGTETRQRLEELARRNRQPQVARARDNRAPDWMLRARFECRGDAQHAVARHAVDTDHMGHGNAAVRQRPGLVERDTSHGREPFEGRAALDQHPAPRGAGDRRHNRNRRRDHQRTRAGDDQQRERAVGPHSEFAPTRVGAGNDNRRHDGEERRENHHRRRVAFRKAIHECLDRGAAALRLLDEMNDARERAVGRRPRRADLERAGAVDRARINFVARGFLDWQRFASHRRLIERRVTRHDDAVSGESVAGPHDDDVAGLDVARRHAQLVVAAAHQRVGGRQSHQRSDRAAGPPDAPRFEPLRRAEQPHDRGRLTPFAENRRTDHGEHHQRIDVEGSGLQ